MTRVLVVGAGIGGLTLGITLQRAGVAVEVHERAEELREVGAAVAISANGTRVLARLGLGGELEAAGTQPTELVFRDGRSGERIAAHPGGAAYRERFGAPYLGIHRVDLQQALARAFGPEHLHLGSTVTAVSSDDRGATVTFADGSTTRADVVVGADGVHSLVRAYVAGSDARPEYTGTSGFRGLVPRDALATLPDPLAIQFWAGPDAHLLHYPLGGPRAGDDTVNFLAVLCGPATWEGGNRPAPPGELLAAFAGWHPAVLEMLGAVEQSPRWPLLALPPLATWTRGRVALLGDACHAMLPHHGQGAGTSIEDAAHLGALLATTGPDEALAAYPRHRRARTRAIARSAWETGTLLHLPDDHPRVPERDARFAGYLPANAWVHDHDVAARDHHPRRTA
ncbi:FAD-dependent monooxygenase [Actinomycetospora straminea]|uniref:FAD-dependent monooxygenase n=1 Tax=Actinomycetospora straminea TaxID=663607 RepID=A0ABP9E6S8_9PSEU|nr:FAD-dependent monooxygenase [Actinomycetospora straminea]MDD7936046.1 FAD-dependent monooxygenase [Actinomycetospora straminea]